MASKGRAIAESMSNFATGVYRSIDNKGASKIATIGMMNGVSRPQMASTLRASSKTRAYKAGQNMMKSAPMAGITGTARAITGAQNVGKEIKFGQALKQGHSKALLDSNGKQVFKDGVAQTRLSKSKIAGTAATVGVAGRVASGGGLYRDRYGNVNVPGVPFI